MITVIHLTVMSVARQWAFEVDMVSVVRTVFTYINIQVQVVTLSDIDAYSNDTVNIQTYKWQKITQM